MTRRRESNSWTRRWQHLAALMDYGHAAEVQRGWEERDGSCQPPPGGKLPRRNVRAGQNGRPPSGKNRTGYRGTLLNAVSEAVAEKPAFSFSRAGVKPWPLSTNHERTIPPGPFRLSPLFPTIPFTDFALRPEQKNNPAHGGGHPPSPLCRSLS